MLDLDTGSGALAVEAARLGAQVTAVISWRALTATWCNAFLNGQTVRVRHGDLASAVPGSRFDLMVTNPPYVPAPPGDGPGRAGPLSCVRGGQPRTSMALRIRARVDAPKAGHIGTLIVRARA
ncbi:methyltransferase [Streptomyces sp. NPDC051105]|uniref:methyltransferase n=1 Tax=Streptomyces sp. NPDC051105 TaxID=3154843 RepID=UPI0034421E4A